MKQEVRHFVHTCATCQINPPCPHTTLLHILVVLKWSQYIVEFLDKHTLRENVSKTQKKAIELEAKEYESIANQLYKRGKDKQLRLCVTKAEYVNVLEQAHAGLFSGYFTINTIAKTITMARLWCPTLFQDALEFVEHYDSC